MTCPTCGSVLVVYETDEGTHSYVPDAAAGKLAWILSLRQACPTQEARVKCGRYAEYGKRKPQRQTAECTACWLEWAREKVKEGK